MKRKAGVLSEFVSNQYPIEKFKKLIQISVDIAQTFLISLGEEIDYTPKSMALFSEKYGSSIHNNKSKVESIVIKRMRSEEQMLHFLTSYFKAYRQLTKEEQQMFDATFIENLTDIEITVRYDTYSDKIRVIRKSAIVKFCVRSGLDKFVDTI